MAATRMVANAMNINSRIYEAKVSLDAQKTRVNQLRRDLEHEETKLELIETQLNTLRSHQITQPHPISRLPTETLSFILRETIGDARQNVVLMLVCREWQRIIEADPQMWSRIVIIYPERAWNVEAWTETVRPVVQKWIARSGATLLDINLEFDGLLSTGYQLQERFYDGIGRTVSELNSAKGRHLANLDSDLTGLFGWLRDLHYNTLVHDKPITEGCSGIHIMGLLADLIGQDGEAMRRWQSFRFNFPAIEVEDLRQIWVVFCYPTPHLHTLILNNYEDLFQDWEIDAPTMDQVISHSIFPQLPLISKLDISIAINWDLISLREAAVRDLIYVAIDYNRFISRIGSFQHLKQLEITSMFPFVDSPPPKEDEIVHLPLLEELIVSFYPRNIEALRFLLPKLVKLTLWPSGLFTRVTSYPFPMLSPRHVIVWGYRIANVSDMETQTWLKHCISHFRQTEEISFRREHRIAVTDIFKGLLNASTEPEINRLKCVSFFNTPEDEICKELWTIEELQAV